MQELQRCWRLPWRASIAVTLSCPPLCHPPLMAMMLGLSCQHMYTITLHFIASMGRARIRSLPRLTLSPSQHKWMRSGVSFAQHKVAGSAFNWLSVVIYQSVILFESSPWAELPIRMCTHALRVIHTIRGTVDTHVSVHMCADTGIRVDTCITAWSCASIVFELTEN